MEINFIRITPTLGSHEGTKFGWEFSGIQKIPNPSMKSPLLFLICNIVIFTMFLDGRFRGKIPVSPTTSVNYVIHKRINSHISHNLDPIAKMLTAANRYVIANIYHAIHGTEVCFCNFVLTLTSCSQYMTCTYRSTL